MDYKKKNFVKSEKKALKKERLKNSLQQDKLSKFSNSRSMNDEEEAPTSRTSDPYDKEYSSGEDEEDDYNNNAGRDRHPGTIPKNRIIIKITITIHHHHLLLLLLLMI